MRSSVFLFTACTLLFTACSNELSEEDARLAYVATYSALAQGSAMATTIANTTPLVAEDGVEFRNGGISPRAAAGVDFTWACPSGGSAHYVGNAEAVTEGAGAGSANFTLATTFDACATTGITITGDLDYAASVSVTADGATTQLTMKGSLSYEGQVDGSCDWDLTMKVATTGAAGGTPGVNAEYSGTMCGHKASATLNVQG
jgi:hypothetical protein